MTAYVAKTTSCVNILTIADITLDHLESQNEFINRRISEVWCNALSEWKFSGVGQWPCMEKDRNFFIYLAEAYNLIIEGQFQKEFDMNHRLALFGEFTREFFSNKIKRTPDPAQFADIEQAVADFSRMPIHDKFVVLGKYSPSFEELMSSLVPIPDSMPDQLYEKLTIDQKDLMVQLFVGTLGQMILDRTSKTFESVLGTKLVMKIELRNMFRRIEKGWIGYGISCAWSTYGYVTGKTISCYDMVVKYVEEKDKQKQIDFLF